MIALSYVSNTQGSHPVPQQSSGSGSIGFFFSFRANQSSMSRLVHYLPRYLTVYSFSSTFLGSRHVSGLTSSSSILISSFFSSSKKYCLLVYCFVLTNLSWSMLSMNLLYRTYSVGVVSSESCGLTESSDQSTDIWTASGSELSECSISEF